ncbi:MAG TPA: hypothetical protein VFJ64_10845 [Solirubrobacterales bacterium]|nr:hypothetical protein [Solirubrobacterales bacterium]
MKPGHVRCGSCDKGLPRDQGVMVNGHHYHVVPCFGIALAHAMRVLDKFLQGEA